MMKLNWKRLAGYVALGTLVVVGTPIIDGLIPNGPAIGGLSFGTAVSAGIAAGISLYVLKLLKISIG